jgi:hypothetical protein
MDDERVERAPDEGLMRTLAHAATGLLYTSEGDHPLEPVAIPFPSGTPLTAATFAAALGEPPDAVQERTIDRFLRPNLQVAESDETQRAQLPNWQRLRDLLNGLAESRAFRIPRAHGVVDCWAVGRDGEGHLVGYHTTAIET